MPRPGPAASATAPGTAFIVVDGRRWRASDPHIPANLRQELVNELMSARRAVRAAKSASDVRIARRRVNDAKVALGERGPAWWLPREPTEMKARIDAAMRALLRSREVGRSVCPSDVARIAGGTTWRTLMPVVRDHAVDMAGRGELEILQRGRVVEASSKKGVLRYRVPVEAER
jgi:hypothetical protein